MIEVSLLSAATLGLVVVFLLSIAIYHDATSIRLSMPVLISSHSPGNVRLLSSRRSKASKRRLF